jgi:hypothetical protein
MNRVVLPTKRGACRWDPADVSAARAAKEGAR